MQNNLLESSGSPSFSYAQHSALPACSLDLKIITKSPLKIKTSMLQAGAHISLQVGGTVADPQPHGTLELMRGQFTFPYQPLYITHGLLQFAGGNSLVPRVDIVAKNHIKRYGITMTISGLLTAPEMHFSAQPQLEREQIITLLFGGSEDGTLFLSPSEPLGDSLHNLFFGSVERSSGVYNYFSELLKPLRSVRIIPSLSDQRGRGGLRGAVAVEVNDRLRALVQQNFSLTEDTRWEVEYDVSDDTRVRAVKDEHGDVGAEFEVGWKF